MCELENALSKDLEEVTRVLNLYIDGAGNGNADYLWSAFHESARWFGSVDGVEYDVDKDRFIALMVEQPGNPSRSLLNAFSSSQKTIHGDVKCLSEPYKQQFN